MMLTDLDETCRNAGLKVVEIDGWKTRGRPAKQGYGPGLISVNTITCHHTANGGAKGNYPSLKTVKNGRGSAIPGPLSQLGLGRDGTVYIIAAGVANHPGISQKVTEDKYHAIGIEAEAVGLPDAKGDWPEKQMEAYAVLCKALIKRYGLKISDVKGHKETCSPKGRKSDPSFDMDKFRTRISHTSLPLKAESKTEENDMEWTENVALTATDAAVWNLHGNTTRFKKGSPVAYSDMVRYPTLARKIDLKLNALSAAMAKLATAAASGKVSMDALKLQIADVDKDVEALAAKLEDEPTA